MIIELKKFGEVLTSRSSGKEAFAAILPTLDLNASTVEIDFSGVLSLSPSWGDEFFRALEELYGNRVSYLPSDNPSVNATLEIIQTYNQKRPK
jgi:hypothetical protein